MVKIVKVKLNVIPFIRFFFSIALLLTLDANAVIRKKTEAADAKSCLTVLDKLIDSSPKKFKHLDPPLFYEMNITETRAMEMGNIAKKGWNAFYDPKKLTKILERIAAGKSVDSKDAAYLKKLRKRSILVKSVVQILGDDHKPPSTLSRFNSKLGLLNDARPKNPSWDAQGLAATLLQTQADLKWNFTPDANVKKYFDKRKNKIIKMVKNGSLDDESLHDVRKMIRQLMMITYLHHVIEPTPEGEAQVEYLHALSRALANFRSSRQMQYQIPKDLKSQILNALNNLAVK